MKTKATSIGRSERRRGNGAHASVLLWSVLVLSAVVPLAIAATSPLLEWRQPVYIVAGLAGVIAMVLLLAQPLLVGGYLAGMSDMRGRRVHRWVGATLIVAVLVHVAGLWITSPPDVIDVLLFRSPTPFSIWGVVAMWAVFAAALLAALRSRFRKKMQLWRLLHSALSVVVVAGTVVHALLIEGTMGTASKVALCIVVVGASLWAIVDLRSWDYLFQRNRSGSPGND